MGQLTEKYKLYREPQKFMEADVYPYFRAIEGKQGTEVEMGGHKVLMFGSNACWHSSLPSVCCSAAPRQKLPLRRKRPSARSG